MLQLFNSLGKKIETFEPANRKVVNIFTCGPSVYQRAHIGNFRTFLFEDILVRYLEYRGYTTRRGMAITDLEDKAISEAVKEKTGLRRLTDDNIRTFMEEMKLLRMKAPDALPKGSETVEKAVDLIKLLMRRGVAYRHGENVYFDPLKFPEFGKLYGLDMSSWPTKKRRFHKDTYQGMRWNRGDFILWHGCARDEVYCWDTKVGKGRPSWNIQDAAMVSGYLNEPLSLYCGGIDNLVRHHDYTCAILESARPYPMSRFWLHCQHLHVEGKKMSKSRGNVRHVDTLLKEGYSADQIRFFLIYGHYRKRLNFSLATMESAARKLRVFRDRVQQIEERGRPEPTASSDVSERLEAAFIERMDDDLDVKAAFDALCSVLEGIKAENLRPGEALHITQTLRRIDDVLQIT
jgi:cysteinyl-tRNA synthetase